VLGFCAIASIDIADIRTDQYITPASLNLAATLHSPVIWSDEGVSVVNIQLTSALNAVAAQAGATPSATSQSLTLTESSVAVNTGVTLTAAQEALVSTLGTVALNTNNNVPTTSVSATLTLRPISTSTDAVLFVTGQQITTSLNSPKWWAPVNTYQSANWQPIAFDQLLYGYDCAIATQPLCSPLQALRPEPLYPNANFVPINTTQTPSVNWKPIPH
jgi:hypothetical protein